MDFLKNWGIYITIGVISLVIFIILMATGTQMDDIKPGDGFSTTSKSIIIQANEDKWLDTGIKFDANIKKLGATVNGSIALCSETKTDPTGKIEQVRIKEAEIIVPAVQCKDNNIPNNYPEYGNFIKYSEPYKNFDWSKLCENQGGIDKSMNYKNSRIKVSEGDIVEFELIPNIQLISNCGAVPSGIIFDKSDIFCNATGDKLTSKEICQGDDLYSCGNKGKKITSGATWIGQNIIKIESDDPSPKGNKWAKIGTSEKIEYQYIFREPNVGSDDWYIITTNADETEFRKALCDVPYLIGGNITTLRAKLDSKFSLSSVSLGTTSSSNWINGNYAGSNGRNGYYFYRGRYLIDRGSCAAIGKYCKDENGRYSDCKEIPPIITTQLATVNWLSGSFVDLRNEKFGTEIDNINDIICKNPGDNWFNGFGLNESPLINQRCKNYVRDQNSNLNDGGLFSYYGEMEKVNIANQITITQLKRNQDGTTKEYAEHLVARIASSSNDTNYNSSSELCITNKVTTNVNCLSNWSYDQRSIEKQSLRLNYPFRINSNSGLKEREIQLIIGDKADNYNRNLGGYNVKVKHSCPRNDGDQLYYYIGSNPNGMSELAVQNIPAKLALKPGDPDTVHVGELSEQKNILTIENNSGATGNLYFKIADNDDSEGYNNNLGHYEVNVTVPSVPTWVSDALKWLIEPVKNYLRSNPQDSIFQGGATKSFYDNLLNNGIRGFIKILLILFIVITAISFTIGIVEMRYSELFYLTMKFALVATFLSDTSWYFLNKYFFNLFWNGTDVLITQFSEFYNKNNVSYTNEFLFLDKTFGVIFQWQNIVRFLSLFCQGFFNPISWFMFIILAGGLKDMIIAGAKGVILYVTCFIISGFLIALAPIFICFILFRSTKRLFDGWIKQLISNMMVPVIYFAAVGLLNEVLYYSLYQIFNFGANVECMLPIDLGPLKLCLIYFPMPFSNQSIDTVTSMSDISGLLPVSFAHLIVFIIISKAYLIIIDVITILPTTLFGAGFMFRPMDVANSAVNGVKYAIGMDDASIERRKSAEIKKFSDSEESKNNKVNRSSISGGVTGSEVKPLVSGGIGTESTNKADKNSANKIN